MLAKQLWPAKTNSVTVRQGRTTAEKCLTEPWKHEDNPKVTPEYGGQNENIQNKMADVKHNVATPPRDSQLFLTSLCLHLTAEKCKIKLVTPPRDSTLFYQRLCLLSTAQKLTSPSGPRPAPCNMHIASLQHGTFMLSRQLAIWYTF